MGTISTRALKLILAFTLIAFAGYVYLNPPMANRPITEPTENPENPENKICLDYDSENMSTLDADLIHEMTDSYKRNQWDFINSNPASKTTNDAYSIWFDLETLKKFIYHIEEISMKTDASVTPDKLGVRIYYAAYPYGETMKNFPDLRPSLKDPDLGSYGALHTLVMIPTMTNGNGAMMDFNPLDKDTYEKGLSVIDKYKAGFPGSIPNNTAALSGTSTTSRNTSGRNHGVLYPPTGVPTSLGF